MLLSLALICFLLGFATAVVVAGKSRKHGSDIIRILNQISNMIHGTWHPPPSFELECEPSFPPNSRDRILMTKDEVEATYDISTWQRLAYEDFKTTILATEAGSRTFPCIYATMGYRTNEHRYLFLRSNNPAEPQNVRLIGPALQTYLRLSPSLGRNTSLVIVGAPHDSGKSVADYNTSFWDMLRGLRIWDQRPWPEDVPQGTEDEKWTFCFDGQPVFPVMLTPAHTRRWSRHMSVPIIALQPKWVIDQLLSTPEKREHAIRKVRKLLKEYDQVEISPDLTSFGEPGSSESRQLCLLDDNETAACPYSNIDR